MTAAAGTAGTAGVDIDAFCFAARALAQSHAMTEPAHRYRQTCVEQERLRQPVTELADWAGTAMLVGYCLRRSEESRARDAVLTAMVPGSAMSASARVQDAEQAALPAAAALSAAAQTDEIDLDDVGALAESLRVGDPGSVSLLPAEATVAALDRIIATELEKRHEHLREQLDDASWLEFEEYIAWWVIHGYALRASERPRR